MMEGGDFGEKLEWVAVGGTGIQPVPIDRSTEPT